MGLLGDLTNVGFDSVQAKILATAIGGGSGSATWGDIVGSLSNQIDLQNALNAKADLLSLAIVALTGSYDDLSDKPTIPTVNDATLTIQKNGTNVATFTANSSSNATANISVPTDTNDLTNGAGYITSGDIPSGDLSSNSSVLTVTDGTGATLSNTSLTLDTDLSKYDNSTSDFVDSTALATKQDVIDNNNPLSASYVSGLSTVATSGDYDDLLNKPTIPTVNDATLTIQRNSTNIGTFTANASSNATIDITVPTDTNDLTNGAGYITGISNINDIGDVTITTPSTGDLLKYDGSKWVNGSPSVTATNWGDILGSLSNQTDLQNALDGKQDVIDANNKLDYSLLSNTPTIPTVNDATLTLQQNGTTKGTFTANASSAVSIDFTDTNTTSGITVNSSLVPDTDNAYNLGSSNSGYYNQLYAHQLNLSGNAVIYSPDSPSYNNIMFKWYDNANSTARYVRFTDNAFYETSGGADIGTSTYYWNNAYFNNYNLSQYARIYPQSTTGCAIKWYNGTALADRNLLFVLDSIYPYQQNTISLGQNGYNFTNVWSNRFNISNTTYIETISGLANIGLCWTYNNVAYKLCCYHGNVMPGANNALNLGADGYRWKKVFALSGTIDVSDRRTKEYIEPLDNALEKVNSLGINSFVYKDDPDHIHYGIIAQDEMEKNPELVYVPEDYSEKENGGELGVISSNVKYLALKAIQELSAKVTNLEQELKTIKGDNYGN